MGRPIALLLTLLLTFVPAETSSTGNAGDSKSAAPNFETSLGAVAIADLGHGLSAGATIGDLSGSLPHGAAVVTSLLGFTAPVATPIHVGLAAGLHYAGLSVGSGGPSIESPTEDFAGTTAFGALSGAGASSAVGAVSGVGAFSGAGGTSGGAPSGGGAPSARSTSQASVPSTSGGDCVSCTGPATTIPTPEPGTLALLVSAAGFAWHYRRRV